MKRSWLRGSAWERWWLRRRPANGGDGAPIDIFGTLHQARKILIIPSDRVGGIFLATPVFKILRQFYPQAQIQVLTDQRKVSIAGQIPFIDQVLTGTFDRPIWSAGFRELQETLIKEGFDLVFCLGMDCSFRLAHLCQTCQARLRVGFRRPGMEPYNLEIAPRDPERYEKEQYLQMLRLLGMEGNGEVRWILAREKVEQVRARYLDGEGGTERIVGVDLNRGEDQGLSRRQIDDIVGRVVERGYRALLFFSLADQKLVEYLKKNYGNKIILFAPEDVASVALLLQGCQALIACHTELLHLGIALGVPSVGLFVGHAGRWVDPGNAMIRVVQIQKMEDLDITQVFLALDGILKDSRKMSHTRLGN